MITFVNYLINTCQYFATTRTISLEIKPEEKSKKRIALPLLWYRCKPAEISTVFRLCHFMDGVRKWKRFLVYSYSCLLLFFKKKEKEFEG